MIFLNQKMNLTKTELKDIVDSIKNTDIVLFPTMPLLSYATEIFPNVGSQDVSEYLEGAYTGQTSVKTLKSLGIKYCLIGHPEKRFYLNETEDKIIKKIELCVQYDITPILIIGETAEQNLQGQTSQIIESQITSIFNNLHCELKNIIIAYEPIWSIGTNKIDTRQIDTVITTIKALVKDYYDITPKVIYGGGINSLNIDHLCNIKNLDGYLLGSSSIKYEEIAKIYENLT